MSLGPGRLQRAILEFMRVQALRQRTPQREHWRVEQLVLNVFQRDRSRSGYTSLTSRQKADARKQIRRACASLVATGLLLRVGVGWTLPPETSQEAKIRRKRHRISERREQEETVKRERTSSFMAALWHRPPLDRTTRGKLIKVLGLLSSAHDPEVLTAARLRVQLGCTWDALIANA